MTQELREKILSAWGAPEHDDIMPKRADAAIAIIRAEVLEEAASMIETRWQHGVGDHYAAAIRALKEKP